MGKEKIEINSQNLNYEVALDLKKELDYIKVVFEKQKVELNDGINRDIFNYYVNNGYISIVVFFIRNGKLLGDKKNIFPLIDDIKETLEYYIVNFYSKLITKRTNRTWRSKYRLIKHNTRNKSNKCKQR